jgi:hypothetical protein
MNDQEIMQFLKDYFYHVSKAFDQVDCYLISEC